MGRRVGGRERLKSSLICQVESQGPDQEHLTDSHLSAACSSVQPLRKAQWLHPEPVWVQTQETRESTQHHWYHKHWGIRVQGSREAGSLRLPALREGRITQQLQQPAWFQHKLDD